MSKDRIGIVGLGWLGKELAKRLASLSVSWWGTSRSAAKEDENGVRFDIREASSYDNLPACDVLVFTLPPSKIGDTQDEAEFHLKAFFKHVSHKCRRAIYISSTSVYTNDDGIKREEDGVSQISPHSGMNILRLEELVASSLNGPLTILRFGGLFGPGRQPGQFIRGEIRAGQQAVNMLHLDDAVGSVLCAIEQSELSGVFNICSPEHPTRADFYSYACKKLGKDLAELQINDGEGQGKIVDSNKFIEATGYEYCYKNPIEGI